MAPRKPRENLSKQQLAQQAKQNEKVNRAKEMARTAFSLLKDIPTIYDAQTVFNAVTGHLMYGMEIAEAKLTVGMLDIDMDTGKDSAVKTAVEAILAALKDANAKEARSLMDEIGNKLPQYVAQQHMQDPMTITAEEFIAK